MVPIKRESHILQLHSAINSCKMTQLKHNATLDDVTSLAKIHQPPVSPLLLLTFAIDEGPPFGGRRKANMCQTTLSGVSFVHRLRTQLMTQGRIITPKEASKRKKKTSRRKSNLHCHERWSLSFSFLYYTCDRYSELVERERNTKHPKEIKKLKQYSNKKPPITRMLVPFSSWAQ